MVKSDREIFESEWAILQTVWKLEPCAAPTVQEALQEKKKWSYSTVKTIMDRMVKKGLLKKEKICNLYLYQSGISQSQAQKSEVMKTLKRAFNGTLTPLMQFLLEHEDMADEDLIDLERIIKDKKRCGKRRKKKKLS